VSYRSEHVAREQPCHRHGVCQTTSDSPQHQPSAQDRPSTNTAKPCPRGATRQDVRHLTLERGGRDNRSVGPSLTVRSGCCPIALIAKSSSGASSYHKRGLAFARPPRRLKCTVPAAIAEDLTNALHDLNPCARRSSDDSRVSSGTGPDAIAAWCMRPAAWPTAGRGAGAPVRERIT
jgi:hypothetical protein